MSKKFVIVCNTPKEYCTGSSYITDQHIHPKAHGSRAEAFRCHARYLKKVEGYTQIGSREFRPNDGGPVLVMSKKSRYGSRLRRGKGESGRVEASRYMPGGTRTRGTIT